MMLSTTLALAAIQVPIPVISPIPGGPPRETLTTWRAGEVRCEGEVIAPTRMVTPYPTTGWSTSGVTASTLSFRIDAGGRPLGISAGSSYGDATDLGPSLAVSQFPPGGERRGCSISYAATRTPIAEAAVADAIAVTIFPVGRPSRAVWDRIKPPGATCMTPPPALRNRAFPDFDAIPQVPGTTDWSMIGHDIDARGRPVKVRVVAGTGKTALDRASVDAVKASGFGPGARTGCLYPYWRRGDALAAAASPEPATFRVEGTNCPTDIAWDRKPVLSYPEPFRRRNVEGWAVIGFDVAPWGQTGNVRVLAAEPAADFGEHGMRTIRAASKAPGSSGYTGCVERVRFVMGKPGVDPAPVEPPPPF